MKNQMKPKMAMKKTVTKTVEKAQPSPTKKSTVPKTFVSAQKKPVIAKLAKDYTPAQKQAIAKGINERKQLRTADSLALDKKYKMIAKKEAERRKSIGVTGRIKEDVKKAVRDLSASPRMRL